MYHCDETPNIPGATFLSLFHAVKEAWQVGMFEMGHSCDGLQFHAETGVSEVHISGKSHLPPRVEIWLHASDPRVSRSEFRHGVDVLSDVIRKLQAGKELTTFGRAEILLSVRPFI